MTGSQRTTRGEPRSQRCLLELWPTWSPQARLQEPGTGHRVDVHADTYPCNLCNNGRARSSSGADQGYERTDCRDHCCSREGGFLIRATLDAARAGSCTNSRYSVLGSSLIYEADHGGQHFHIPVRLSGKQRHKDITAMVDSGATTKFLN